MGGNEPTLENGIQIAKILEDAGVELCMFQREYLPLNSLSRKSHEFPKI